MNTNWEKVILTPEEAKKQKTGFCTIFNKKNNKPLDTLKTVWDFTENHGIAYGIIGWLLWEIKVEDREELEKELFSYVNNELDPKEKAVEIEAFKEMFEEFNKKYRILIG